MFAVLQFLDTSGSEYLDVELVDREKQATGRKKHIRCRSCHAPVTDESERVTVAGKHVYVRANPAGIEYEFGCFRAAEGCTAFGNATAEYTWFPGYRWQVSVCRQCGIHLGWLFSGQDRFFGLILSQLQQEN
ncbi:MAG TPA: cereblon family protein [Gammaproteobacteria bacterium]|nr:cereblon family protein [Gammaproteobacteria bacterium]